MQGDCEIPLSDAVRACVKKRLQLGGFLGGIASARKTGCPQHAPVGYSTEESQAQGKALQGRGFRRALHDGHADRFTMQRRERADFRLPRVISTSAIRVLRRTVETARNLSNRYTKPRAEAGIVASFGSVENNREILGLNPGRFRLRLETSFSDRAPHRRFRSVGWVPPMQTRRAATQMAPSPVRYMGLLDRTGHVPRALGS